LTEPSSKNESDAIFQYLSQRWCAAFGAASAATAVFVVTPQIVLLFYLTEVIGAPPAWAGGAILLPRLLGVVMDPLIGAWSDRTRCVWGRRRPFMTVGALAFPIAFAGLFAPPPVAGWPAALAWITLVYCVSTIAFSVFAVPYVTLPGELADDQVSRVRINAWRMAYVALGVLVAGGAAPLLVEAGGGGRAAYAQMGLSLSAASGALMLLAAALVRRPGRPGATKPSRWRSAMRATTRSPRYRRLWLAYVVQMAAVSMNAAMLPYAVQHQLGASADAVGALFVTMTLATLAAMPLTVWAGRRFGVEFGYAGATVISAVGVSLFALAGPLASFPAFAAATVLGVGQAGGSVFPFALFPGAIGADDPATAADHAGLFAGIWVAGEKLGLGIGGALAGLLLGAAGFAAGDQGQTEQVQAAIPLIFAVLPAALLLASVPLILGLRPMSHRSGA
jgi:glycoside/pentoside/hexuronide:cation symporter, GPH family